MSTLRAILVDLDGTLADTAEANWRAYRAALSEVGVTITRQAFEQNVRARNWREFLPEILIEHKVNASPAAIAARKVVLYKEQLSGVALNTALIYLLRGFPGIQRALVTSASRASVDALLEAHTLTSLFDIIVTGDDVKVHKPDPEAYQIAASLLGVSPDECLIFEDSDVGVAGARAFGGHILRITL